MNVLAFGAHPDDVEFYCAGHMSTDHNVTGTVVGRVLRAPSARRRS